VRILVVRLGALGDIVHTVPAVAALAEAIPGARIDWLVERRHREVLDVFSLPLRAVEIDPAGPWHETLRAVRALRAEAYDAALDFQGLLKSAVLARASGAARVIGFGRRALREPVAAALYTETVVPPREGHVIRKNLALLGALELSCREIRLPLSDRTAPDADPALPPPVVLNPGAGWPNKRWPPDRFGELAARLQTEHGLGSVVSWGPGERDLAQAVVDASAGAARLATETSIVSLVRLLRGARLMVSGDTGPIHLAAAAGCPIVGVYGPTSPERNGPWAAEDLTVSRHDDCRCHHKRRCTAEAWCLDGVGVDEVARAVARRLGSSAR
jgi:lipopolysaccharide heptosyltransferase I